LEDRVAPAVNEDAKQWGASVTGAEAAEEGPAGDEAAPAPADKGHAGEGGGLGREAEEDICEEIFVLQDQLLRRRRRGAASAAAVAPMSHVGFAGWKEPMRPHGMEMEGAIGPFCWAVPSLLLEYFYIFFFDFRKINGRIKISRNIRWHPPCNTTLSACCRGVRRQESNSGGRAAWPLPPCHMAIRPFLFFI
jgi:hypothetical protein